jgi:hypothetical protein
MMPAAALRCVPAARSLTIAEIAAALAALPALPALPSSGAGPKTTRARSGADTRDAHP